MGHYANAISANKKMPQHLKEEGGAPKPISGTTVINTCARLFPAQAGCYDIVRLLQQRSTQDRWIAAAQRLFDKALEMAASKALVSGDFWFAADSTDVPTGDVNYNGAAAADDDPVANIAFLQTVYNSARPLNALMHDPTYLGTREQLVAGIALASDVGDAYLAILKSKAKELLGDKFRVQMYMEMWMHDSRCMLEVMSKCAQKQIKIFKGAITVKTAATAMCVPVNEWELRETGGYGVNEYNKDCTLIFNRIRDACSTLKSWPDAARIACAVLATLPHRTHTKLPDVGESMQKRWTDLLEEAPALSQYWHKATTVDEQKFVLYPIARRGMYSVNVLKKSNDAYVFLYHNMTPASPGDYLSPPMMEPHPENWGMVKGSTVPTRIFNKIFTKPSTTTMSLADAFSSRHLTALETNDGKWSGAYTPPAYYEWTLNTTIGIGPEPVAAVYWRDGSYFASETSTSEQSLFSIVGVRADQVIDYLVANWSELEHLVDWKTLDSFKLSAPVVPGRFDGGNWFIVGNTWLTRSWSDALGATRLARWQNLRFNRTHALAPDTKSALVALFNTIQRDRATTDEVQVTIASGKTEHIKVVTDEDGKVVTDEDGKEVKETVIVDHLKLVTDESTIQSRWWYPVAQYQELATTVGLFLCVWTRVDKDDKAIASFESPVIYHDGTLDSSQPNRIAASMANANAGRGSQPAATNIAPRLVRAPPGRHAEQSRIGEQ